MQRVRTGISVSVFVAVLVVAIAAVASISYFTFNSGMLRINGKSTSTYTVTGSGLPTNINTTSETYLTNCIVSGIGGFELRVVSDSTGAPVSGENVTAIDELGCDIVGQPAQTQVVRITNFSVGNGSWLTPIFPAQAEAGGRLNFTIAYQGQTYNFVASVPGIGTNCVVLHLPSGSVTSTTVMNGSGSYCT